MIVLRSLYRQLCSLF